MRTTRLLALLAAFAAFSAFGTQILWVGIDDNAIVHLQDQTINIADWIATLANAPGGRIRIGDTALYAGFEDPSGYIPPGQTAPSVVWETDFEGEHYGPYTDFDLQVVDTNGDPMPGQYADWQPIKLPDDDSSHIKIYFDIGYFDENNNYDFVSIATAVDYVDNVWNAHTYTTSELDPPTATPWRPKAYYAVPEPSTALLGAIGILLLMKRRKT